MRSIHAAVAAALFALPALADDPERALERARSEMHEALEAQATPPARPPALPDQSTMVPAAPRDRAAERDRALEQKGEAARAAHEQSVMRGAKDAEAARAAAANRAARGSAAGAMGQANAETRDAAGMMRTMQPGSGMMNGGGMGGMGGGMMPETAAPATGAPGTGAAGGTASTPAGGMR